MGMIFPNCYALDYVLMWKSSLIYACLMYAHFLRNKNQAINQNLLCFPHHQKLENILLPCGCQEAGWQRIYVYCFCDLTYGMILKNICNSFCFYFQELELQSNGRIPASDTEESDDELPELDLATGNKDTCVLEVQELFISSYVCIETNSTHLGLSVYNSSLSCSIFCGILLCHRIFWNEFIKDPVMAHLHCHSILNNWKQCIDQLLSVDMLQCVLSD